MAVFVPRFVRQLRDVLLSSPADGEVLTYDSADGKWKNEAAAGGGGGGVTDHGALTGLADDDHPQYETTAEVAAQVSTHSADTTAVHGIADTSLLVTDAELASLLDQAVILAPATADRNTIEPSVAGVVPLKLVSKDDQETYEWLLELRDVDGEQLGGFDSGGGLSLTFKGIDAALIIDGATGQIGPMVQAISHVGGATPRYSGIDHYSRLYTGNPDVPIDEEIYSAGYLHFYFDPTDGAAFLKGKAKTLDGTVVTFALPVNNGIAYASGGTDVAVADGGTGSSTAGGARTNLGLVIGTDVPAQATFDDHSARHETGGADAIKLDDLAAPDDNTDLNASTTKHGLLRKLSNTATEYLDGTGAWSTPAGGGGGGAPTTATYITQTADAGLSAEQALSSLATGLVKNTTGTGVLSIGAAGTDYYAPGGTDVAVADGGTGSSTAGGARTNLGLVIGTDVQGYDADLAAIAALADPNADRLLFWDDSAGAYTYLTPGTNLTITGTTLDAAGGSGVPHARKTGSYYSVIPSTADATLVATFQVTFYIPFPVYTAHTIDRLSLGVSGAGGVGSVIRLGIYNSDANGQPSTVLLDAGTINGTSTTYQEISISQLLSANTLYWVAVCAQVGTAPTVRAFGAGNGGEWVAMPNNSSDPRTATYTQTGVTGAFATASISGTGITNPAAKVRVA